MTLIVLLLRLALLAIFTFAFVVLFEHGPKGFVENAQIEGKAFADFVKGGYREKSVPTPRPEPAAPPAQSAPLEVVDPPLPEAAAPAPVSTPESRPPSAWEQLQNRPIGQGINAPVEGVGN